MSQPQIQNEQVSNDHTNSDVDNVKTVTFNSEVAVVGTAVNWTLGQKLAATPSGATTFVFTNPIGPCNLTLKLINGAGNAPTFPAAVNWPGGTPPDWSAGTDIVSFYFDGTSYFGMSGLAFA